MDRMGAIGIGEVDVPTNRFIDVNNTIAIGIRSVCNPFGAHILGCYNHANNLSFLFGKYLVETAPVPVISYRIYPLNARRIEREVG